jgi:hypothetical protein
MARSRDISKVLSSDTSVVLQEELEKPFRNLIINGDMQIAQRSTSVASITSSGYNTADRYRVAIATQGTWTQSVENDAPTGSGFRKSLKMLCTTADASPAAGDEISIQQNIEGQNIQHIKKGTAAAEQLTLSFWVKSNVTGTYVVNIADVDNSREVSKSYTINASGTWEREVITFPADTTGAFDNDNALSLSLSFGLGAGSNYTSGTLQQTWAANTAANRFVGQTNLASATSNYWQVTGIQLEVGDTATPFEFKPFEQDLRECQRYYEKSYDFNVNPGTVTDSGQIFWTPGAIASGAITAVFPVEYKVPKRIPDCTITYYSPTTGSSGVVRNRKNNATSEVDKSTGLGFNSLGENRWHTNFGAGVGATEYFNDDSCSVKFHWTSSAEL